MNSNSNPFVVSEALKKPIVMIRLSESHVKLVQCRFKICEWGDRGFGFMGINVPCITLMEEETKTLGIVAANEITRVGAVNFLISKKFSGLSHMEPCLLSYVLDNYRPIYDHLVVSIDRDGQVILQVMQHRTWMFRGCTKKIPLVDI